MDFGKKAWVKFGEGTANLFERGDDPFKSNKIYEISGTDASFFALRQE